MRLQEDAEIAALWPNIKTIAVIGVSNKPERPSHKVFSFLCDEGFSAIPVNPGLAGQSILGRPCVASLDDIDAPIDMVDVFRQGRFLSEIVAAVKGCDIKCLWTQKGVRDEAAEQEAIAHNVPLVVDRCPKIEIPRLRALGYDL
ncbi:MAG: CoA-binding protein [Parvibaculales bacterium]